MRRREFIGALGIAAAWPLAVRAAAADADDRSRQQRVGRRLCNVPEALLACAAEVIE
jgi:hypothetical protein